MSNKGSSASHGQWGRLKPFNQDALETYGLPSKGDARLLDAAIQEQYYTKIVEKYMSFCSDAGQRDELLRRFSSLEINNKDDTNRIIQAPGQASFTKLTVEALQGDVNGKALSDILSALRKLREGIVASKRFDSFAVQAYLFCIRLAILVKQPNAYHPAILYLLRVIHIHSPLTAVELQEVASYLILDTACRRRDLSDAFSLRRLYGVTDTRVNTLLRAISHDNYVLFQRTKRGANGHQAKLLEYVEEDMKIHTLKCFGRTYLSVGLSFLEESTCSDWEQLKSRNEVGWGLEGDKVIIRKVKGS